MINNKPINTPFLGPCDGRVPAAGGLPLLGLGRRIWPVWLARSPGLVAATPEPGRGLARGP